MRTATVTVQFYPPAPPDGLPNYRPRGYHIYQIRDEAGRKLVGGSFGPDKDGAWAWALKQTQAKGFTHYRTPDDPVERAIAAS